MLFYIVKRLPQRAAFSFCYVEHPDSYWDCETKHLYWLVLHTRAQVAWLECLAAY